MRQEGFFAEVAGAPADAISVVEATGTAGAERARIARYLADGYPVLHVPDAIVDPLRPDRVAGTSTVLTDGEWVWPHALSYFVREHGVAVAEELVARARARAWSVPELSQAELEAAEEEVIRSQGWVETEFGDDPFGPLEETGQ
jgi:hypothetical protein